MAASELAAGTDPRFADTDGDGINDPTELNITLTNPLLADSDGDGANDGSELAAGTNPLDGSSRFAVKSSVKAGVDFTITWASQASRSYHQPYSPIFDDRDFFFNRRRHRDDDLEDFEIPEFQFNIRLSRTRGSRNFCLRY